MKRIISVMMLLVMVFSLFTIGHAAPESGSMVIEPEQVGEVLELREKNSETYRLEDGSYECVVFAEDKYFEDETGKLVEISNTVVPEKHTIAGKEYGFTNEANSNRIYFSEDEPSVLVSTGKQDLAFNIVTDRAVTPVIGGLKDVGEIAEYSLSGDTCFAYMNAFEHTDLVYKVRNGMLKEYIVLNDASAPREFTFTFGTEGYTVAYTEYGTVGFYDGEGELVFELGDLFAVDSADALTDELAYTIGETIEGKTEITVTLSDDYANDPERVYPILVDPSVVISGTNSIQDSFVSSKNPTNNYYTSNYIRMGWDSNYNVRRTYIRFDLPASIPSGAITESYMSLKKYDCGNAPSLKAYRVTGSWTSNSITWDNKPGYTSTNASDTAEERNNNWYRFYVTDIVKKWYAGTYQNYGFMVKNSTESGTGNWSTFYSSDADSPNKPELRITYSSKIVLNYSSLSLSAGSSTTLSVSSYEPSDYTLRWVSSNTRIASVNSTTGYLTAKACGKVTIKVYLEEDPNNYATIALTVNPSASQATGISSDGVYMIKNASKGLYLTASGSSVSLASKNEMDGKQLWYVKKVGNSFKLYSMGRKDSVTNGKSETFLVGTSINSTPYVQADGYTYWSIHKYNGYYYLTNIYSSYMNTSVSANSVDNTINNICLDDETVYARWAFERIDLPTFNNYWGGGYNGYSGTIYIKINVDDSGSDSVYKNSIVSADNFDVISKWQGVSSNIIIYGPSDSVPSGINAFQITFKGYEPDDLSNYGRTVPYNLILEAGLNDNWHRVSIFLNVSTSGALYNAGDDVVEKVILHELGHAMKLAHPKQTDGLASVTNGRGGYPGDNSVTAIMNQGNPMNSSNLTCGWPKMHDIINLKNKWE